MKRVVLTGGPAGGKSTAIRHLEANHSHTITTAPEAATMLLQGGFPTPDESHPWTPEWQRNFQSAIAVTQMSLEDILETRAVRNNRHILVCDRGLADGAAYLPGGIAELGEMTGLGYDKILGRYALVLHLTSSAKQSIGYQKHTNPHRLEDSAEALKLEDATMQAWESHPNRIVVNIEDHEERNIYIARTILSLV